MHVAYTKDPITNKLAAFKLPEDIGIETESDRKYIIDGIREDFHPGNKTPVLIMIDTKVLNKSQEQIEPIEGDQA